MARVPPPKTPIQWHSRARAHLAIFFGLALLLLIQPQHKNGAKDRVLSRCGNLYICLIFAFDMAIFTSKPRFESKKKASAKRRPFYLDQLVLETRR